MSLLTCLLASFSLPTYSPFSFTPFNCTNRINRILHPKSKKGKRGKEMASDNWTSESEFHQACITLPLPTLIDEIAARSPTRPFVSLPINNDDLSEGYKDLSYNDFARSVDRCAWWILSKLGRWGAENERRPETKILAYVGPQDVRYAVLMLGAVKAGYSVSWFF